MTAAIEFRDRAIDRRLGITQYENLQRRGIEELFAAHEVRLQALLKSVTGMGNRRLVEKKFREELRKTYSKAYTKSKRSLLDFAYDQVAHTFAAIEQTYANIYRTERPTRRVSEDFVLNKPLIFDKTLAQGWEGIAQGERSRVERMLREGIADGESISDLAKKISASTGISRNQASALTTTAITSVTSQADHAVFDANKDILRGYLYVAILDSRTSDICLFRSGQVYALTDKQWLPPAHYRCRSTTVPVFKSYKDLVDDTAPARIRRQNLEGLTPKEQAFYDGAQPYVKDVFSWLKEQPKPTQLKYLGSEEGVSAFLANDLPLTKFSVGGEMGLRQLREASRQKYSVPGDTRRFADAKAKLDDLELTFATADDLLADDKMIKNLEQYYLLQAGELDGSLSLTNYRGALLGNKRLTKQRVLASPPTEANLKFNPFTNQYDDARLYPPVPEVHANVLRLVQEDTVLKPRHKQFIIDFDRRLSTSMGLNQRAVVADNLRNIIKRQVGNNDVWINFKAVSQGQIKFDVMNVSQSIETGLRKNKDVLKRLRDNAYIDPVLGPVQISQLQKDLIPTIIEVNRWDDKVAPKIASRIQPFFDSAIPLRISSRLSPRDRRQFYLRFVKRLAMADGPDRDNLAVSLGRDLYNTANLNGSKKQWLELGTAILDSPNVSSLFKVETFGVQKRRLKNSLSGRFFGPYYDTMSYYIQVTDPELLRYSKLVRQIDVGIRMPVVAAENRFLIRPGFKTYFIRRSGRLYDTRIPVTSTSSFSDFPEDMLDADMADALNWASTTEYRVDSQYYDFIDKLLNFADDKGNAERYNNRNHYRAYILSRTDSYERFRVLKHLSGTQDAFSNHAFIDHRARIYDRGLVSAQAGETFRPFLNTKAEKVLGVNGYQNFNDQVGSFLGGLNDTFEGTSDSLTILGRQEIASRLRPDLVRLGDKIRRGKPQDIRDVLDSRLVSLVEGEEQGKLFRLALEAARIDDHLSGDYSPTSLLKMNSYKTSLALEQDASSSGAQIIALTTRNKRLAELSNVVLTNRKQRLYDEIARETFNDPEFQKLNTRLGLTERDLKKAAKAQNMVTFYGAGERTGVLNVEGKLGKVLSKQGDTLVVKTSDKDQVLDQISARIARFEKFDPVTAAELRQLRTEVKDIFDLGKDPGLDIMDELFFLDEGNRELVEKMTRTYDIRVTPNDFKAIAAIMSEKLSQEVPILKDFTKYFGRLALDFMETAKPSESAFDWQKIAVRAVRGERKRGFTLPDFANRAFDIKPGTPLLEATLNSFEFYNPNSGLADFIFGVEAPEIRRTGAKYFKIEPFGVKKLSEVEFFYANKLPKSWTRIPWVNFDGKTVEQNFTASYEQRITYKNNKGEWVTSFVQVDRKTEASWWDQLTNASGKINDVGDGGKARTAFAVNGNHSNDATLVKQFHIWGKKNGIATSTIHDAFFTNAGDMLNSKRALQQIYANSLNKNSIQLTLLEMRKRGLPKHKYDQYLEEAIQLGLIPIAGKSRVGGKLLTEEDILTRKDVLQTYGDTFDSDKSWYGIG